MLIRAITLGLAGLVLAAAPSSGQERGTVEFGAFGNWTFYDSDTNLDNGLGLGLRVGAFIFPALSVEFDVGRRWAGRSLGLADVEVEAFAARLVGVPMKAGPVSLLAGAGLIHTDYEADVTDGVQALLGVKYDLPRTGAVRVDGVMDFNGNDTRNIAIQAGVSLYRHPGPPQRVAVAAPAVRRDAVSATEIARLRAVEREYNVLRVSLAEVEYTPPLPPSSAAALATMAEVIHFDHDQSTLSAEARSILDAKVAVFRGNPAMRIVITGFTSSPGSAGYNMALGLRRAETTKAYLVASGVDPVRVEIATKGQGELLVDGPGERAAAANRRGEFRLLVADPYLTGGGR